MSLVNVIAFWRKVQGDASLRAKVGGDTTDVARVVEIAQQAGCSCTKDELVAADNVIRFWADVAKDTDLQQELASAKSLEASAAASEIVRVASGRGYAFTAEQMTAVTPTLMAAGKVPGGQLDEESLARVSGGVGAPMKDLSVSLKTALGGGLDPKLKIGPGLVPTLRV